MGNDSIKNQIDAIYQKGVFKPLQDVVFAENQRVRLSIQPVETVEAVHRKGR